MASSGLNFENLTPDNGAVRSLSELLFLSLVDTENLGGLVNFIPGQKDGKKIGFLGAFGLLGTASQGCEPEYGNDLAPASEKTWSIKEWEIAESICYEDIKNTLAQEALRKKTAIADLTGTEYMDLILNPLLKRAVAETIFRIAFFGDTAASTYSAEHTTGTLKAGVAAKYFTITDGFWKHIFTGVAANKIARVTVAANNGNSIATQKSQIKGAGVATGILDDLIAEAPLQLRQQPNGVIMITQALADAVNADIKANNKGSDLQWKALFAGIQETQYNGVRLIAVPQWDVNIKSYLQNTTNANAYDKPYRAIYTVKDNLFLGSESDSMLEQIDAWFDKTAQKNFILVKDTLGTLIADENLIAVAY